jgi:predicted pyridoxine 5'-phosphate oxidase superfamily flavin-nucleotide-binding protein
VTKIYTDSHRVLQDCFQTRALADRVASITVHDWVTDEERAFIESRDMLFLATIDPRGFPSVSYKGGDPGFVRVVDEKTLAFPSYNGNGMFYSTGNISANGRVGLLFIDFENPHRLRVHGRASASVEDPLTAEIPGAELMVRVVVEELFVNCPRYVHRYRKMEESRFVPRGVSVPPMPDWKRIDAVQDVLPAAEQRRAAAEGLITTEEYNEIHRRDD